MSKPHEAIYRSLFIQTRGVLKKELTAQLRTAQRMRRCAPRHPAALAMRREWG